MYNGLHDNNEHSNNSGLVNGSINGMFDGLINNFTEKNNIAINGLKFYYDTGNIRSYPTSGNTLYDLSVNNNHGTLVNGPTYSNANGGSILFDGVNDSIIINKFIRFIYQDFTISIWVNPQAPSGALTTLIDNEHTNLGLNQGWVIQSEDALTNRNYYLAYYNGTGFEPSGNIGAGKGVQLTNNSWQNIVYTKSGTSVIGYKNGASTFSVNAVNRFISYRPNKFIQIGNIIDTINPSRFFKGNIGPVSFYDRPLPANEVLQNYNSIKSRFGL